ncbi:unnamed protein product [Amoebophrya sp. A25]|nr:unnamed protein product [Amoebophrya sp. A25]|eukprot:GSA25T00015023001.1
MTNIAKDASASYREFEDAVLERLGAEIAQEQVAQYAREVEARFSTNLPDELVQVIKERTAGNADVRRLTCAQSRKLRTISGRRRKRSGRNLIGCFSSSPGF